MNNFYTVIENQMPTDSTHALLYYHYDDVNQAYAKLYTILASASVSTIPYHAGCIIRSDGIVIEGKAFDRRSIQQE